jgi:hypothetical protein
MRATRREGGGKIGYGQAVAMATQNLGRTGPIAPDWKMGPWAVISGAVAFSGAPSSLAAAYLSWRSAWVG